jgi:hypothetical protein
MPLLRRLTLPPRRLMPLPLPRRLLTLPPRLLTLPLRPRRRSSNRLVDYCLEPIGSMTARAERTNVCLGFVFLGEA